MPSAKDKDSDCNKMKGKTEDKKMVKNFEIYIPFEKKVGEDGQLRLFGGIASSTTLDRDNDRMDKALIKKIAHDLNKNNTVFFNHDTKGLAVGRVALSEPRGETVYIEVAPTRAIAMKDVVTQIEEGLLKNFSIGGRIKDWENVYDEKLGKNVRVIKDVDCYEVSVVGIPANPEATILDYLVKSFEGDNLEIEKESGGKETPGHEGKETPSQEGKEHGINKECAHKLLKCASCGKEIDHPATAPVVGHENQMFGTKVKEILDSPEFKKGFDDFSKVYEEKYSQLKKEYDESSKSMQEKLNAADARIEVLHKSLDERHKSLATEGQDELGKSAEETVKKETKPEFKVFRTI